MAVADDDDAALDERALGRLPPCDEEAAVEAGEADRGHALPGQELDEPRLHRAGERERQDLERRVVRVARHHAVRRDELPLRHAEPRREAVDVGRAAVGEDDAVAVAKQRRHVGADVSLRDALRAAALDDDGRPAAHQTGWSPGKPRPARSGQLMRMLRH